MRHLKRTAMFTLLTAAFITAAFLWLPPQIEPADPVQLFVVPTPSWQGVLRLWLVNDWRTATGSRTAVLQAAARGFERKWPGLFIEIENLDPAELAARLENGERPDLLAYPGGMGWPVMLTPVPVPCDATFWPQLAPAVPYGSGGALAVPWIFGTRAVLVNATLAAKHRVEKPDAHWTSVELLTLVQELSDMNARRKVYGIGGAANARLGFALHGALPLPGDRTHPADTLRAAYDAYAAGDVAVLLGSQWEAAAMDRARDNGRGVETWVLPMPADRPWELDVQWICVVDSANAARSDMAVSFVQWLLSPRYQQDIAGDTGCFSVLADSKVPRLFTAWWGEDIAALVADPFDVLPPELTVQAAGGDEEARKSVAGRCIWALPS